MFVSKFIYLELWLRWRGLPGWLGSSGGGGGRGVSRSHGERMCDVLILITHNKPVAELLFHNWFDSPMEVSPQQTPPPPLPAKLEYLPKPLPW